MNSQPISPLPVVVETFVLSETCVSGKDKSKSNSNTLKLSTPFSSGWNLYFDWFMTFFSCGSWYSQYSPRTLLVKFLLFHAHPLLFDDYFPIRGGWFFATSGGRLASVSIQLLLWQQNGLWKCGWWTEEPYGTIKSNKRSAFTVCVHGFPLLPNPLGALTLWLSMDFLKALSLRRFAADRRGRFATQDR